MKGLSFPFYAKSTIVPSLMNYWTIVIALLSVVGMLALLIFKSTIKIGRFTLETFWIPPFLGAILVLAFRILSWDYFWGMLTSPSAINPLEILVLFLSMSLLSIILDEAGFFAFLASRAVILSKGSQLKLFTIFFLLSSILTVFTSNDIIILTFTPFLIFFAKRAHVDPIPYLFGEFVSANTWSLLFLIGNPTNIYLGESFGIDFATYFLHMWPSTLFAGVLSYLLLLALFHKKLKDPIAFQVEEAPIKDRFLMVTSLLSIIICLALMALSSVVALKMWLISGISAATLVVVDLVYILFKRDKAVYLLSSFKRLPYPIIPFILSMFALVMSLKENGFTLQIANALSGFDEIWGYGLSSFFVSNAINNIPMSVLYSEIIKDGGASLRAVYASIIGSNLGAYLSPLGALAGVMWMSILKKHDVSFSFLDFLKYGVLIALPCLAVALAGLYLVV